MNVRARPGLAAKNDAGSKDGPGEVTDEMKKMVAVRKKNAELYRRYARDRDPLLAAMGLSLQ